MVAELTGWMAHVMRFLEQGTHTLTNTARWSAEVPMAWVHDLSLAALAAAVIVLGLVMLLELRSLAQLRRSVDQHLTRVFEQLDLLRFDYTQLLDVDMQRHAEDTEATAPRHAREQTQPTSAAASPPASLGVSALAAGEARLLASLAEARARRNQSQATKAARAAS